MKYLILFCFLCGISCKKYIPHAGAVASLQVINGIVGGPNIGFNNVVTDTIKSYNARVFTLLSGMDTVIFYSRTTAKPYYNHTYQVKNGGIYSIFLCGIEPAVETVWVEDLIPGYYTDSSIGVRILNLSPNSNALNVTLASATTVNVFKGVNYKQYSDFVKLPLKTNIPTGSISFQVRNNETNALLGTYTLPSTVNSTYPNISTVLSRNRNVTLVVRGLQATTSGGNAFGIFPVANY